MIIIDKQKNCLATTIDANYLITPTTSSKNEENNTYKLYEVENENFNKIINGYTKRKKINYDVNILKFIKTFTKYDLENLKEQYGLKSLDYYISNRKNYI